ncbi:hypothetical protein OIU91_02530 [Streptomyces sp. NBC_01456]|nr:MULTISPECIES: hypothetical protein [unclassified Streptomyces]
MLQLHHRPSTMNMNSPSSTSRATGLPTMLVTGQHTRSTKRLLDWME